MAPPARVVFTDFSGGWAPSRAPSSLAPNELVDLNNYVIGPRGELMTRPPLLRAGSDAHPAEIWHLNVKNGEQAINTWGLLVGNDGSGPIYAGFDETGTLITLSDIPLSTTLDPYPNTKSVLYKDIFYVYSDGVSNAFGSVDVPVRADVFGASPQFDIVGISTPGAPTVVAAAGGALAAATYQCVVTFYNPRTGAESNIGAVASVTTAGPNLQIAWSNIPTATLTTSGQAQVQYRRLWRTLPNQTNEYYLVTTLTDNTTTTFADNVGVASLGSRAFIDGFVGLFSVTWTGGFALWRERLWATALITSPTVGPAQDTIIYSRVGLVENYTGDAFLPVGMNDNSPLVGLEASDDYLLAFKALSVYRISGTGPSNFRVDRLRSPTGLADTYAVASGPPGTFFLGSDGYFYFTDGNRVQNISEQLGELDLHTGQGDTTGPSGTQVQSIVWPARNWFMTVVYAPSPVVACSGSVTGIIGDGTGEAAGAAGALGWAKLCHSDATGQEGAAVQADSNGVFLFENVPCGDYDLILWDDAETAYRSETGAVTVTDGVLSDIGSFSLNTLGAAPACPGDPVVTQTGSVATIYVYDYVRNAWAYWEFTSTATRPRPRCLTIGYNQDARAPRLYVGGQTDDAAFVNYFDDDLFNNATNDTDLLSAYSDTITDTPSAPPRSIRTKDFDAKDFGLPAGTALIIKQVLVRIAWPTSITSNTVPDGNWELNLKFYLHGDTNKNQVTGSVLASTGTLAWSAEDRANDQWHAVGLSSQEQATTSVGLEIVSAEEGAPRRHSITGIAFEYVPVTRDFVQPGSFLLANISGSISGTVTGGAGGTAYLCPTDTSVANQSMTMDGSGNYAFTGLPAGEYLIVVNDAANANSAFDTVTIALGEDATLNFASLDIAEGSVGCPIA